MLVLSRKPAQRILIGDGPGQIRITIVRIGRNSVRVGIDAPPELQILREELLAAVAPQIEECLNSGG